MCGWTDRNALGGRQAGRQIDRWHSLDVLFGRGVPASLIQPRPIQPADGVFVVDGAGFGEAACAKRLERMVSEELAADVVLDVRDWQRARSRSLLFCRRRRFCCRRRIVGSPRGRFAGGKRYWGVLKNGFVPCWRCFEKPCACETGCLLVDLGRDPPHHREVGGTAALKRTGLSYIMSATTSVRLLPGRSLL